jgi:hypothetical protein
MQSQNLLEGARVLGARAMEWASTCWSALVAQFEQAGINMAESISPEVLIGVNATALALTAAALAIPERFIGGSGAHAISAREIFEAFRQQYLRESVIRATWAMGAFCLVSMFLQLLDRAPGQEWETRSSPVLKVATDLTTTGLAVGVSLFALRMAAFPFAIRRPRI